MTTETMTIHRALAEIKMIEKRLPMLIDNLSLCAIITQAVNKINGKTIDSFKMDAKKDLDTVIDLISRRNAIKAAVAHSNAITKVSLKSMNGTDITVAMAIDLKNNAMKFNAMLVNELSDQYIKMIAKFDNLSNTDRVECDNYLRGIFQNIGETSANSSGIAENIEVARTNWMKANSHTIIDPCNLKKVIDEYRSHMDSFMSEIDAVLSESNAVTMITFSYTNNDKLGLLLSVGENE